MSDKEIQRYLDKLPEYLHEYFKLWYYSVDENGNRMGREKFARVTNKSRNTVRNWLRRFRAVVQGDLPKKQTIAEQVEVDKKLQVLQDQLKQWKKKYAYALRQLDFETNFLAVAKELIQSLPVPSKPIEVTIPKNLVGKRVQENLTLIISDIHAGEVVTKEETYDFNEYDFSIMVERIQNLFGTMLDISQTKLVGYKFRTLNIDLLGDMLSGIIHEELAETNDLAIVEAILLTAFVMASAISAISPYFERINIHGVVGNHGRLSKKVKYKKGFNNYDYLFYQLLRIFLAKHDHIKFDFPKSWFLVYKNNGYTVCIFHGDSIRTWAGVPWYGIQRAINKLSKMLAKKGIIVDIWEMGHFHQDADIPDNVLVNGSLIGPSEYSIKRLHSVSPAVQKLYGCHKDIGITFMYRLRPDIKSKVRIPIPKDVHNLILDREMIKSLLT